MIITQMMVLREVGKSLLNKWNKWNIKKMVNNMRMNMMNENINNLSI